MEVREILISLFDKVEDKILIQHRIKDNLHSKPDGMSIESFFYHYTVVIDDFEKEFHCSREERVRQYKKSIDYNNSFYVDDEDIKRELNKHNLNEIKIAESDDYSYGKLMGYDRNGEPIHLSVKESDILDIKNILKAVKTTILESSNCNVDSSTNNRETKIKDEGVELFANDDFRADIFKNVPSQKLALDFMKRYKSEKETSNANFGFLYYAMIGSKLIHCSGSLFIKYLAKHDIIIDRIDSKQASWKTNSRYVPFTLLYEKHIKSI